MSGNDKKLTASDFKAWCEEKAAEIEAAAVERQRDIDRSVIKSVMNSIRAGKTINEAGDEIMQSIHPHPGCRGNWTPGAALKSLLSIGWVPPADRKGG